MDCRRLILFTVSTAVIYLANALTAPNIPRGEKDPAFWMNLAKDRIQKRKQQVEINKIAKNLILFIGDGMGPTTVTAARILRGQLNNRPGEESVLAFEEFPNVALSKTYNVDRQTAGSAGTATAILSGVKTNYFIVGLDGRATASDCLSAEGKEVETLVDWALAAGKRTGIVTTSRITHATPAAAYAHAPDRYWEGDVNTAEIEGGCRDIAQQLIDDNKDINVLLGGGRRYMLPNNTEDPETNKINSNHRRDGRNLIKEWEADKAARGLQHKYVWNKGQFDAVDYRYTDYLLGLFEPNHMQYELDRDTSSSGEPSLAEMTKTAIEILSKEDKGYFLLVEGARIDHGHHDALAKKALHETLTFEDAIMDALRMTNKEETLVIVMADHSHVFDIAGYAYRGTDIFGLVEPVDPTEETLDDKPYSVLLYGNGPAYSEPRENLTGVDMHDKDFAFPSGVPAPWETHGGEDVAIYAQGPMAHLIHGVQEQNYIAHVMAYSS
ncbi:alkaline phosphatase, tissue-nonspecific isozyme-like [Mercenaria mercenaria]|uniref:alkaline phosphatase, tissue-nonspecific isozyme-like n=1 Tax=Mercenaria mercenaria TaxID=6596 RepID=UPI00234FA2DB|nr:alkaline phosphatase, tissue-nonspecific isozyme-like [Mercenaria mercenaria]